MYGLVLEFALSPLGLSFSLSLSFSDDEEPPRENVERVGDLVGVGDVVPLLTVREDREGEGGGGRMEEEAIGRGGS